MDERFSKRWSRKQSKSLQGLWQDSKLPGPEASREHPQNTGAVTSLQIFLWRSLSDFPFTFHFHALEKAMATHSSVLAWRIPGEGEPGGLPSVGSHRIGHDWSDLAAAAALGGGLSRIYPGAPGLIHCSSPGLPLKPKLFPVLMFVSYRRSQRLLSFQSSSEWPLPSTSCSLNHVCFFFFKV